MFHLIYGCVFSNKTSTLICELAKYGYHEKCILFKHTIDDRFNHISKDKVFAHNKLFTYNATTVKSPKVMYDIVQKNKFTVVGIDELQFFDKEIKKYINMMLLNNIRVIASSLHNDYMANSWETFSECFPIANKTTFLKGKCADCGKYNATFSYKKDKTIKNGLKIIRSSNSLFIPKCFKCFNKK